MTASLPRLTESQVSALATEQSWQKGKRYFRTGAIANPVRQDHRLWADCEGTVLYRTEATLSAQGIQSSTCTCPYDWGGICKHQVALLLTYVYTPEVFQVIQPLAELLGNRSREDLLQMIEQMVQRHPDLLTIVDAPPVPTVGEMPDLAKYRRQAERIFQGDEMHSMAAGLEALVDHGDRLRHSRNWLYAGEVYQLLLAVANEYYDYAVFEIDYNGEVACRIQDIAAGLQDSLIHAEGLDADQRRRWVETIFEAFLHDLKMGGIDYGYPAGETLVEHTTAADWEWLEPRIHEALQKPPKSSFSDWDRRCLVNLLAVRAEQQGQAQQAEAVILDLGTPEQRAFRLLEKGNYEEAVTIAQSHFQNLPGIVHRFADALLAANELDRAIAFVQTMAQTDRQSFSYQDWLAKVYKEYGRSEQFVVAQSELLKSRFSIQGYQELQAQAAPLGQWEGIRESLLADLEAKNAFANLIDIALVEKNWQMALYNLKQLAPWGKADYQAKVAQHIGTDQPGTAIVLYQELITAAIERRGRDNYQQAAQYLQAIQPLYAEVDRADEFQQYLQQVRSQHKRLPALQQELDRAGL